MSKRPITQLSRRERQIMDVLFQSVEATVADVLKALPDPPSYSSVRALLGVLEEKGYIKHKRQGRVYVYTPTVSRTRASRTMLKHVVYTFFDGSVENVVAALMTMSSSRMTDEELDRLSELIETMRTQEDS